ncbi:hypothetical protein HPULCUR_007036 [Helicostylum pulchrum]|uniref:Cytochrome P450 n=1 Tax=Helicostylum pulchrum TaxID=562976 RepID=A0ABP9Y437_9FUNG
MISISAAVDLSLVYLLIYKITKPPRNLRHIHYLSYLGVIKSIYYDESTLFPKIDISNERRRTLNREFNFGHNVGMINRAHWKAQKKVINPAFRRSMPVKLFGQLTQEMFKSMENKGKIFNASDLTERWTLDAIGIAGFEFDFNSIHTKNSEWVHRYALVNKGLRDLLLGLFPYLDTKLRDEPCDVLPTIEDTKRMTYINQIVKETLRINGPVSKTVPRVVQEDIFLSGAFVPKGTLLVVNMFGIQHSNKIWSDPDVFNRDRFAESGEGIREDSESMAWAPFGYGSKQCIGMNFSLNQQRVMLSMLLRKYRWSTPEDSAHKNGIISTGLNLQGPVDLDIAFSALY